MTTKRKRSRATEREGVNYVRGIVEAGNSTFTEIGQGNDLGNDAYIEFTLREDATGCCIVVQIKSGSSHFSRDGRRATLRGDRDHFEYWSSHLLPVGAVIFDPRKNKAAWFDVTAHLAANPEQVANGTWSISVTEPREFSAATFHEFRDHFLQYRDQYRQDAHFGRSLEKFSNLGDPEACLDGIRSLFSFHRQRLASWYFVISCFRYFRGHRLRRTLVHALCHIPGHGDIYWHDGNIIDSPTRRTASSLIRDKFGREEMLGLLEVVDEWGYERGTIGQCVHAIIDLVEDRTRILGSIAFDIDVEEEARAAALWLLIYYTQGDSPSEAISFIKQYIQKFPHDEHNTVLREMARIIEEHGSVAFY